MFEACTKCCYETLAEILNKMAFPNLGPCSGRSAFSPHVHSADSHQMLPLSTSGSQRQQALLLPCQPAPSAARAALLLAACARKVCTELADTQAQLPTNNSGQDRDRRRDTVGQQPRQDLSGTHHGFGGCAFLLEIVKQHWKETTSFHSLLLKAGIHLNQQHLSAETL